MGRIDNNFLKICVAIGAFALLAQQNAFANDVPLPKSDNNAYTLTKVDQAGENTITKYEWSDTENKLMPINYRIDLMKTEYGHKDVADSQNNYTITGVDTNKPDNHNFVFNVKYYVDNKRLSSRLDNFILENGELHINNDFIGNTGATNGGAINHYNTGATKTTIIGDFIENNAAPSGYYISGGAIFNNGGEINQIQGDFIGNYAYSKYNYVRGGAIANVANGCIDFIEGDFLGNYGYAEFSQVQGGAISNSENSTILAINSNFIGNRALSVSVSNFAEGGAIYNNQGKIGNITGDFISNYSSAKGGTSYGGAIYNRSTIGNIKGDFIGNYAFSKPSYAIGGAIYNNGEIGQQDDQQNLIGGIYGSFINNYAKTESDNNLAIGGAVYTSKDMNFIADNQTNVFSGNYTEDYRGKIPNAIFVETAEDSSPTIKLQAQNKGSIVFDDQIDGGVSKKNAETGKYEIDRTNSYNLTLTGDKTGTIYLNNSVINAKVTSENVNLNLGKNNVFQNSDFTINSGTLGFINGVAEQQIMKSANINGNINMAVDVDLQNEKMDTLPDNVVVSDSAKIGVNNINLINDATKDLTNIQFATDDYKSQVSYTGASPIAYSPIYKYEVSYNPDEGFFTFSRGGSTSDGGGSSNPSDAFNPAVLAPSVATQAGAYTTQLQTFNYAFQHSDTFMNIPYLERVAMKNTGRYAVSPTGDATDVGTFSPLLTKEDTSGFWVKPYASFENIPLNNGPKVSNINYGTLVGYDSSLTPVAKGWERVLTGYVGYNGASQRYSGVDAYQNGGILGGTATMYKGNFFNATTLSVGATAGDASTMYGNENYAMLLAGIGNKTGYNFEFKDGRIILQPNFLISYTFVNTFDYTNGAGVRIKSDPLNAIQLAPGLKLIGNTKNGWQPYLSVAMIWNLLDDSKVTANDVRLPEMSIDPYVQYGAGIQKRFKDRFIAFGQAMIHNGGRNGVSLTGGIRWSVGK